jgi:excisionase family DNA binding protein
MTDQTTDREQLLTADQIAERLVVSKRTFYRLISAGRFPPGIAFSRKCVRWRRADVLAFLDREESKPR